MKKSSISRFAILTGFAFFLSPMPFAIAEDENFCEVMSLSGDVLLTNNTLKDHPVREGDLIKPDDEIKVGKASYVDLAFDSQWQNVTRIREDSVFILQSVLPAGVYLEDGDIFAKLDLLPTNSTFEIETPTAVAAVRGSAFRTMHSKGITRVQNFSKSPVTVFSLDKLGGIMRNPAILDEHRKTLIKERGVNPVVPEMMSASEIDQGRQMNTGIKGNISQKVDGAQYGKIKNVNTLSDINKKRMNESVGSKKAQIMESRRQGRTSESYDGGGRAATSLGSFDSFESTSQGNIVPAISDYQSITTDLQRQTSDRIVDRIQDSTLGTTSQIQDRIGQEIIEPSSDSDSQIPPKDPASTDPC
jgi:hypothetical protein